MAHFHAQTCNHYMYIFLGCFKSDNTLCLSNWNFALILVMVKMEGKVKEKMLLMLMKKQPQQKCFVVFLGLLRLFLGEV